MVEFYPCEWTKAHAASGIYNIKCQLHNNIVPIKHRWFMSLKCIKTTIGMLFIFKSTPVKSLIIENLATNL